MHLWLHSILNWWYLPKNTSKQDNEKEGMIVSIIQKIHPDIKKGPNSRLTVQPWLLVCKICSHQFGWVTFATFADRHCKWTVTNLSLSMAQTSKTCQHVTFFNLLACYHCLVVKWIEYMKYIFLVLTVYRMIENVILIQIDSDCEGLQQ